MWILGKKEVCKNRNWNGSKKKWTDVWEALNLKTEARIERDSKLRHVSILQIHYLFIQMSNLSNCCQENINKAQG